MVPSVTETLARSALSGLIDRYAMKLQFGIASFFATVPTVVFCTAWFTGCALIESPAERGPEWLDLRDQTCLVER